MDGRPDGSRTVTSVTITLLPPPPPSRAADHHAREYVGPGRTGNRMTRVLAALQAEPERQWRAREIAELLGDVTLVTTYRQLARWTERGLINRVRTGRYAAVAPTSTTALRDRPNVNYPALENFTTISLVWRYASGPTGRQRAFALVVRAAKVLALTVDIVKRTDNLAGFRVLPRRWVVERSFGWLVKHRRLVRDYETRRDTHVRSRTSPLSGGGQLCPVGGAVGVGAGAVGVGEGVDDADPAAVFVSVQEVVQVPSCAAGPPSLTATRTRVPVCSRCRCRAMGGWACSTALVTSSDTTRTTAPAVSVSTCQSCRTTVRRGGPHRPPAAGALAPASRPHRHHQPLNAAPRGPRLSGRQQGAEKCRW